MNKLMLSMAVLSILVFAAPGGFAPDSRSAVQVLAADTGNGILVPRPAGEGFRHKEVYGEVVAIDQDRREIIINEDYSHLDTPIKLKAEDMPRVSLGDKIKVLLQYHHTNVAYSVIIVEKKTPGTEKEG